MDKTCYGGWECSVCGIGEEELQELELTKKACESCNEPMCSSCHAERGGNLDGEAFCLHCIPCGRGY
jgi:hypothetical protein